ncbi:MAG: inositol monophosphatase [Deltaproteobacteria bacterium]|nr:inositol monophosphatase [Deltaproteobacteria bacterium]
MWRKEMETAQRAAMEAGRILKGFYGNLKSISKKGEIDLVTEADLASEKAVIDIISRKFPDDMILAEESGEQGEKSDRLWIIDPLDGTTNFAHSFPFFAVSIGFQAGNEIVAGVVYNPVMDEFFEAEKGKGAFLNKRPIKVSGCENLTDSLVATGFPYNVHKNSEPVLDYFKRMIVRVQGIRRPGAASIDLCYVAAGRLDGFWEQDLKPWDTAAGSIILREAGGIISDYAGNPYNPYVKTILASTPGIHDKMIDAFA